MSPDNLRGEAKWQRHVALALVMALTIVALGFAAVSQVDSDVAVAHAIRGPEQPELLAYVSEPASGVSDEVLGADIGAEPQANLLPRTIEPVATAVPASNATGPTDHLQLATRAAEAARALDMPSASLVRPTATSVLAPKPTLVSAPTSIATTAADSAIPAIAEAAPAAPVEVATIAETPMTPEPQPAQVPPPPVVAPAVAAPAPAVVQPVVAAGAGRGPAGVVSQIPASVWQWLDNNGWSVDWRQGPGPGRVAEAQYSTSTIVIWYDTSRSDVFWAGALGHELGHAVSYRHFSPQQMNEWNAMRGLSSWRWVPGTPNDFSVGEGDFAEAFMAYLFGHNIRSVGGPLTQAQRNWIAANTPF